MSDHTQTPTRKSTERPRYRAWLVQDGADGSPHWSEVTGLWPTKSGTGFCGSIRKPVAATAGRLVILPANLKPGKEG